MGGGDGNHSLFSSHNGGAVSSCHSGLSRGVGCRHCHLSVHGVGGAMSVICGFIMCREGSHSIIGGLGPGCGWLLSVV